MNALFVHKAGDPTGPPIVILHDGGQRELGMSQRHAGRIGNTVEGIAHGA